MSGGSVDYQRIYAAVPIFGTLNEEELGAILRISRLFRATPGTVLLREGESGGGMFVVVQGTARVTLHQDDFEDTTVAILKRGDSVGELSLIDAEPHSATVACVETCTLFHVDSSSFAQLRLSGHSAAYKVLRALAPIVCERLRGINERIGGIFSDPERSMREIESKYLTRSELDRLA